MVQLQDIDFSKNKYEQKAKVPSLSFALVQPDIKIETNMSDASRKLFEKRFLYNASQLSCFIPDELDKAVMAKGFTIEGSFASRDEMTYSEKKKTTAILVPVVKIKINEEGMATLQNGTNQLLYSTGNYKISASVQLNMIEPLSNEKIWQKNVMNYKNKEIGISYLGQHAYTVPSTSRSIFENYVIPAKELDLVFKEIAKSITDNAYKYLDAEELLELNKDVKALKNIKRY